MNACPTEAGMILASAKERCGFIAKDAYSDSIILNSHVGIILA
jgi:hypothetical protein